MFVGHYGVSCGARPLEQRIPLWVLFIAVQFLDVLWGVFVLLGIEKVRIVPGITATNPLDLYYMPFTHSLPGALGWAVLAALAYHVWRGGTSGARASVIVGAAVFSHWLLDVLVHRPDLPLWGDRWKIGLSLWNVPAVAFALEAAILFGGAWLYLRSTTSRTRTSTLAFVVFAVLLLLIQAMTFFGAPPASPAGAAITALVAYVVIAAAAGWLDTKRSPIAAQSA
jgi:membrane-bound metal-dependent hydrolase YbcI (DUF457 family)